MDTLTLGPAAPRKTALAESMLQYVNSRVKATGGTSWQVLDTTDAVKSEISSTMQSVTNTSANRSAIPEYLYCLSLEPRTISVVLQWNSDLVEKGLNLGSPSVTEVIKNYTTLNQLAPQQCSEVLAKVSALRWDETKKKDENGNEIVEKDANGKEIVPDPLKGRTEFINSLNSLASCTRYSSLAAFKVASWKGYVEARFSALEKATEKEEFLESIKTGITSMPEEDMGQQSSMMGPFEVTSDALAFSKGGNKDAFINNLGYQFIQSYTERASLNAVWHLHLPDGTQEDIYALRVTLQKYFLGPRTVHEVCSFLSAPENLYDQFHPLPDVKVKVSIFGYRDEFTRKPIDLNDLPPARARHYLTPDALLRNTNRRTIIMRPWQGLRVKDVIPSVAPDVIPPVASDDKPPLNKNVIPPVVLDDIPPVGPEEFFILNTRKAERLLLLLKLYSKDPKSGVKVENLQHFGKTLDKVLDPSSLEKGTGRMIKERKNSLTKLVRDLERALPEFDLECTAREGTSAIVDKNKN